jgi:hypothetical protein
VSKASTAGRFELVTKPDLPPLAEAASLTLAILQSARAARWSDLLRTGPDSAPYYEIPHEVVLDDRQQKLLIQFQHLLIQLRRSTQEIKDSVTGEVLIPATQLLTVAVCPTCLRWMYLSSGSPPSRCLMSVDCGGEPVKASAATKQALGAAPPSQPEQGTPELEEEPLESEPAYNSDEYADF